MQETLLPQASLPSDVDPESERERRKQYQDGAGCDVAQPLPTCVFFNHYITLLDVVAFVFK